jgi:hypothetical protein
LVETALFEVVLLRCVALLRKVLLKDRQIERAIEPQGPGERPATLRQGETIEVQVQMRTTSARCASRVRKQDSRDRDDAQQV